jgi:AbrB family looped-hinge helix DNA binding protein
MAKQYSITSKNQVTLPTEVREALALDKHDQVEFIVSDDGQVTIRKVMTLKEVSEKLSAKFKASGRPPVSDDEIKNARYKFYQDGGKW